MLRFFNKRIHNRKGFTLIELIVVIAILGILAIIAIPRFAGIQERSTDQKNYSNAATIAGAAEVYLVENPTATTIDIAGLIAGDYLRGDAADYGKYDLIISSGEATVELIGDDGTLTDGAALFPKP